MSEVFLRTPGSLFHFKDDEEEFKKKAVLVLPKQTFEISPASFGFYNGVELANDSTSHVYVSAKDGKLVILVKENPQTEEL